MDSVADSESVTTLFIYHPLFVFQNYQVSPSARYELSDGTVLECILPADGEKNECDSALYQNVAVHTDLLPNVYEGQLP